MKSILLATVVATMVFGQDLQPQKSTSPQRPDRYVTCGDPRTPKGSFDPACSVRIFEDFGGRKRTVLYSPFAPYQFNRPMQADVESTILLDFAAALQLNRDVALNNVVIRAQIHRGDSTTPIQVINYSEVGVDNKQQQSQKAFGFQTFDDVSAALMNLYYTTKDIVIRMDGDDCYKELGEISSPGQRKACKALSLTSTASAQEKQDLDNLDLKLKAALDLYRPEAEKLVAFFLSDANRSVAAQLAHRLFGVDYASLLAVSKQIQNAFSKLSDDKIPEEAKRAARLQIAERIYIVVNDLGDAKEAIQHIGALDWVRTCPASGSGESLCNYCPEFITNPPPFAPHTAGEKTIFAQQCYIESERNKFAAEMERYLATGSISLKQNAAKPGDMIILEIESRGNDADTRGIVAKYEIRVTEFGWKTNATDSVLFVERRGVTQADQARGLTKVRFRPAPGFNLIATFHPRGERSFEDSYASSVAVGIPARNLGLPTQDYRLPSRSAMHTVARMFTPGFGLNTSLLSFDDPKGPIQLGVGPIVTLFDNRVSATYGWNIMATERKQYWGLGFSFLQVGKDVVGFFNKKQQ